MTGTRRAALVVCMAWLGLTACGEAFSGGDGGSGGSTSAGTSAGTAAGTETGTSAGTAAGTETGTSAGTATGTETGTSAGTAGGTCPEKPCSPDGGGFVPCGGQDECLAGFCASQDGECCDDVWSLGCAASFMDECGLELCQDSSAVCNVLFDPPLCDDPPANTCGAVITSAESDNAPCAEWCGSRGVRCVGAIYTAQCVANESGDPSVCDAAVTPGTDVECVCALYCEQGADRPCLGAQTCTSNGAQSWTCTP